MICWFKETQPPLNGNQSIFFFWTWLIIIFPIEVAGIEWDGTSDWGTVQIGHLVYFQLRAGCGNLKVGNARCVYLVLLGVLEIQMLRKPKAIESQRAGICWSNLGSSEVGRLHTFVVSTIIHGVCVRGLTPKSWPYQIQNYIELLGLEIPDFKANPYETYVTWVSSVWIRCVGP